MTHHPITPQGQVIITDTGADAMRRAHAYMATQGFRGQPRRLDEVVYLPTWKGYLGRAWRCHMDVIHRRRVAENIVGAWLIEAKYAHPIWHSYLLVTWDLKPGEDGVPPPIYKDGATHIFTLYPLPVEGSRQLIVAGHGDHLYAPQPLNPNFSAQFVAADDADAKRQMEAVAIDIINGRINPDTDSRKAWEDRFGDELAGSYEAS